MIWLFLYEILHDFWLGGDSTAITGKLSDSPASISQITSSLRINSVVSKFVGDLSKVGMMLKGSDEIHFIE